MGQEQGGFCTGGAHDLIQQAGGQDDGGEQEAGLLGQHALPQRGQADGDPRLGDQRQAEAFLDTGGVSADFGAREGPGVFPEDADEEIHDPDDAGRRQRGQMQAQPGQNKEKHENGRRKFVHLFEQLLVSSRVDVYRTQQHTGKERGNIEGGA